MTYSLGYPPIFGFLVVLLSSETVTAASWESPTTYENKTILVPVGSSTYEDGRVLCFPITVLGLLLFFAINFVTHVVTVVSTPGETMLVNVTNMILALFFPTSGLMRGLNTIVRCVSAGTSDLDRACRAGALCGVVRNELWRPLSSNVLPVIVEEDVDDDKKDIEEGVQASSDASIAVYGPTWLREDHTWWIYFDTIWSRSTINEHWSKVHGGYSLPQGYSFAILPSTSIVVPCLARPSSGLKHTSKISSSHSKAKIVASTVQLLYAAVQLFLRSGGQFARYGFASPYFAVVPYAIMSFVNGIAHLFTPEYSTIFMIDSPCMEEARQAGGHFEGVVGRVVPVYSSDDLGLGKCKLDQLLSIHPNILKKFWHGLATQSWLYDESGYARKKYSQTVRIIVESTCSTEDREIRDTHDKLSSEFVLDDLNFSPVSPFGKGILASSSAWEQDPGSQEGREPITINLSKQGLDVRQYAAGEPDITSFEKWYKVAPASTKHDRSVFDAVRHGSKIAIVHWMKHPTLPKPVNLIGAITWSLKWIRDFAVSYFANYYIVEKSSRLFRLMMFDYRNFNFQTFARLLYSSQKRTHEPTKLHIPSCPRFLRTDDPEYRRLVGSLPAQSASAFAPLQSLSQQVLLAPVLCTSMVHAKPRPENPTTAVAITLQMFLGLTISSIAFVPIGYYTHFSPGSSSVTQQVIMMLWLGIGICIGLIMPFFTVTDLLIVLLMSPYYSMVAGVSALGMFPLGIFVPPIWGLVEVWLMLSEHCVRLY